MESDVCDHAHKCRAPPEGWSRTGDPSSLARKCDPIGLTAEVGGYARPNHDLTTVVTAASQSFVVEISEKCCQFQFDSHLSFREWLERSRSGKMSYLIRSLG